MLAQRGPMVQWLRAWTLELGGLDSESQLCHVLAV